MSWGRLSLTTLVFLVRLSLEGDYLFGAYNYRGFTLHYIRNDVKSEAKKTGHFQKLAINKKFTIFDQSS